MTMTKRLAAVAAAASMTVFVGVAILAIGGFAILNKTGVQAANTVSQAPTVADANPVQPAQLAQLQEMVSQYQLREQQYQAREQQYQQALSQAQSQIQQDQQQLQQMQQLFVSLQQGGLITMSGSDGD